jgi:hypothetical protein
LRGHYIRQADAAASECSGAQDQAGCITTTMQSLATNSGMGAGANLMCLHNPSSMGCSAPPPSPTYVAPAKTAPSGQATHDSAFGGGYQIPGQGGGR